MKHEPRERDSSNSSFIKLKPNENVVGVLRGDFLKFYKAFKPGDKEKFRFQINMLTKENGTWTPKILEGGGMLYDQIQEFLGAGWDLEKSYIQISKTGTGLETKYKATVSPKPVPAEDLAKISQVTLRDLSSNGYSKPAPAQQNESDSDLPF